MIHYRAEWLAAGKGAFGKRSLRLTPILFSGLLILSLLMISNPGVSASSLRRDVQATGTTLAMVRAGGAGLYDDSGRLLLDLPGGATLKVGGRTSDAHWFYGSTRDGMTGWVSSAAVVIFGASRVHVREGFHGARGSGRPHSQPPPLPRPAVANRLPLGGRARIRQQA